MVRASEFAGLLAGLAVFLCTLIAVQAFIPHESPQQASIVEAAE